MNNTKQRQLIYETVQNNYDHPTADEIFHIVRAKMPNISLGTVYRNLGLLAEQNKIRKISVPGKADHFDRESPWHDHMVCEKCGRMFDIMLNNTDAPSLVQQLSHASHMQVTSYWLVANCICPDCQETQDSIVAS